MSEVRVKRKRDQDTDETRPSKQSKVTPVKFTYQQRIELIEYWLGKDATWVVTQYLTGYNFESIPVADLFHYQCIKSDIKRFPLYTVEGTFRVYICKHVGIRHGTSTWYCNWCYNDKDDKDEPMEHLLCEAQRKRMWFLRNIATYLQLSSDALSYFLEQRY